MIQIYKLAFSWIHASKKIKDLAKNYFRFCQIQQFEMQFECLAKSQTLQYFYLFDQKLQFAKRLNGSVFLSRWLSSKEPSAFNSYLCSSFI